MKTFIIGGKATVSFTDFHIEAETVEEAIKELENNMDMDFNLLDGNTKDVLEVTVQTVEDFDDWIARCEQEDEEDEE